MFEINKFFCLFSSTLNRSSLRPTTARPGAPRPRLINEPEEPVQSKLVNQEFILLAVIVYFNLI